jgi:hypothetical protein
MVRSINYEASIMYLFHRTVTSSVLGTNILICTLFWNTLDLCRAYLS